MNYITSNCAKLHRITFLLIVLLGFNYANLLSQIPPPVTIEYNPLNNRVTANYNYCNLCQLGTLTAVQSCVCMGPCQTNPPSSCVNNCTPGAYYKTCIFGCCQSVCGNFQIQRTPVSYNALWIFSWAPVLFDPEVSPSGRLLFFDPERAAVGGNINLGYFDMSTRTPWPNIYFNSNTCYRIILTVTYSDGASCTFNVRSCNFYG
jgi:hypothetical protein